MNIIGRAYPGCGEGSLLPDKYKNIFQFGIRKRLFPMDILFHEGDDPINCYLVTKGCLKLSELNAQGREAIIRYIFPGYMTAAPVVLKNKIYPVTAQAIKSTEVIGWNKEEFLDLTQRYPDIALDLLMTVFEHLEDLQTRYLELNSEQLEQRISIIFIFWRNYCPYNNILFLRPYAKPDFFQIFEIYLP